MIETHSTISFLSKQISLFQLDINNLPLWHWWKTKLSNHQIKLGNQVKTFIRLGQNSKIMPKRKISLLVPPLSLLCAFSCLLPLFDLSWSVSASLLPLLATMPKSCNQLGHLYHMQICTLQVPVMYSLCYLACDRFGM